MIFFDDKRTEEQAVFSNKIILVSHTSESNGTSCNTATVNSIFPIRFSTMLGEKTFFRQKTVLILKVNKVRLVPLDGANNLPLALTYY